MFSTAMGAAVYQLLIEDETQRFRRKHIIANNKKLKCIFWTLLIYGTLNQKIDKNTWFLPNI